MSQDPPPAGQAGDKDIDKDAARRMRERVESLVARPACASSRSWNRNRGDDKGNGFATTSPDLARAMWGNPQLRVFVARGRYDLGTSCSATDWSLARIDAPADVLGRIRHRFYDAGHMMFTRQADLAQPDADVAAWLGG